MRLAIPKRMEFHIIYPGPAAETPAGTWQRLIKLEVTYMDS